MISTSSFASFIPEHHAVPGGIAVIELPFSKAPPTAYFQKRQVMVTQQQQQWLAIVGLPLTLKPGQHNIKLSANKKNRLISFQVTDKQYEAQHITVKNRRHVNPETRDMTRITHESKEIKAALRHWSEDNSPLSQLDLPVNGRLSSSFGLRRYFNEQARKPHSGIDIAAPTGTPILSPADGTIIQSGSYFFNGNTLFVDHGQGLITMYCHMQEIHAKQGSHIKRGQQLGTVGSTGRATGPHLHWGVSLNDARIDPALLSPELKTLQQK